MESSEEILIVEDSPTQAEKLKFLLEEKNFSVSVAYNGKEALAFLLDKPRPAIIISDIVMPEMDGYQLCRRIKENDKLRDIPVILLTALSDPRDIIRGLECGADNFITKPYDEKYLLSRIQYVLANKVILETDKVQTGVDIFFGGQKYYITAQRQQILSLLLSTYETAVQTNIDLSRTQDELRATNEQLQQDITERKRVEEALRQREEHFRSLIENSFDSIAILNSEGILLYTSPSGERMLGYKAEEFMGKNVFEFIHPEDRQNVIELFTRVIRTPGSSGSIVYRFVCKDGSWRGLESVGKSILNTSGAVNVVINTRDITERKHIEEALERSEATYRTLTETAQEAIFIIDRDDKIEFVNKFAANMLSLPPHEIIGKSRESLFPSDTSEEQKRDLQKIFVTGMPDHYETKLRFPEYEIWLDTQLVPLKNEKGEVYAVLGISRDISERKRAELEREQFFKFFRISTDLMCIADPNGCFKKVNPACLNMLGYTEAELLAKPFIDFVHPDDRQATLDEMANQIRIGSSLNFENRYICKDGTTKWLSWRANYVEEEGITYATARDVTERKLSEAKLSLLLEELKRSNTELEQFAYIASHDLQEPLRMVGSYVQLIERRYKGRLDPEADDFIAFAVDGAKRMQNMINDLLQYSRVTTRGKPFERTDCNALLESSLVNLKVAIEESNAVITHDPLPTIMADASQIDRVFQNLIGNAIKFRGENPPRIRISVEKKGTDWVFSVKDNGIGFDMQQADRLFRMFQRLQSGGKYPGTGMGLAICKKIIERHGGKIWAMSEIGKGSTFNFTISIKGGDLS